MLSVMDPTVAVTSFTKTSCEVYCGGAEASNANSGSSSVGEVSAAITYAAKSFCFFERKNDAILDNKKDKLT